MDYNNYFLNSVGGRDIVFDDALSFFNKKPIRILEIGCARDLNLGSRKSDGWSTLHFANYLKNRGGTLHVCDINQSNLENCKVLLDGIDNIDITYFNCRGEEVLEKGEYYDLILLDGSDDPNEMVNQFKMCNAGIILCDDFHTKGRSLREENKNFKSYIMAGGHEMAVYGDGFIKKHL